ncbi:MAG: DUF881 domain-containing protein [Dermatophilaceae bacterium]
MPRAWLGARPSRWRLFVPVVAAGAGLMFSMSFQAARGTDLRSDRGLPDLIVATNRSVADKAEKVRTLQASIDELTAAAAPGDAKVAALSAQIDAIGPTVGTRAVHGPALTVSLDDAKRGSAPLPSGVSADDVVVHQQDVQGVVNALWRGGAEAMMIQDQRVVATSAVRCVGNTLILQGRVYPPPYVISAIGDPATMRASLDSDAQVGIYKQWVAAVGLGYEVTTTGDAQFPAFSGSVALDHSVARP